MLSKELAQVHTLMRGVLSRAVTAHVLTVMSTR